MVIPFVLPRRRVKSEMNDVSSIGRLAVLSSTAFPVCHQALLPGWVEHELFSNAFTTGLNFSPNYKEKKKEGLRPSSSTPMSRERAWQRKENVISRGICSCLTRNYNFGVQSLSLAGLASGRANHAKTGMDLIVGATVLLAGCSPEPNPGKPFKPSTLMLTTTSLPAGTAGSAYSSLVAASGGTTPYTYSAASLPNGLSINSVTGAITGTPAQSSVGTASVTIKVTDSTQPSAQSAASNLSLKISPAALAVTTTSLPRGAATSPYPSTTLQASGGVSPYTWALASGSSLPAGLNLSTGGVLSGTRPPDPVAPTR